MKKDALKKYKTKRDFTKTSEPNGTVKKTKPKKEPMFVIQRHDARNLHYDLRLEDGGVLKSWALPKGPPKTTKERHLAIETEDHPIAYGSFEGTIPKGEYGAGTVEIWDSGTFENIKYHDDKLVPFSTCMKEGTIEVHLDGKRLKGNYALIRFKGELKQWIMIKMKKKRAIKEA